jgi:hypothetical protein
VFEGTGQGKPALPAQPQPVQPTNGHAPAPETPNTAAAASGSRS